jgi:hypothetical protein
MRVLYSVIKYPFNCENLWILGDIKIMVNLLSNEEKLMAAEEDKVSRGRR